MIYKMIECIKCLVQSRHCKTTANNLELKDPVSGMRVNVIQPAGNGLMLRVPAGGKAHIGMLKSGKYNISCDNLILIPRNDCINAYFIEMKTALHLDKNGIPLKACEQILNTVPILDYLVSMVKTHFQQEHKTKINKYFAVIAKRKSPKLDKQKIRIGKLETCRYKGANFKIIHSVSEIPLKRLE